jgi:hypothetical protein
MSKKHQTSEITIVIGDKTVKLTEKPKLGDVIRDESGKPIGVCTFKFDNRMYYVNKEGEIHVIL